MHGRGAHATKKSQALSLSRREREPEGTSPLLFHMPRTKARPPKTAPSAAPAASLAPRGLWLTRAAFVLTAAIVIARSTMLETLRNPLDVYPGSDPVPRGPGAGAGVVLDLLACLPAILVLARRAIDPTYALR